MLSGSFRKGLSAHPVHVCCGSANKAIVGSLKPGRKTKSVILCRSALISRKSSVKLGAYGKLEEMGQAVREDP